MTEDRTAYAAKLREQILGKVVWPIVQRRFDAHPQLQSAALLVAQYWDDEADDAVHYLIVYSERTQPDIDYALKMMHWERETWEDTVNLPSFPEGQQTMGLEYLPNDPFWPCNGDAIPAFAAFCCEGAHQEMAEAEAYTPYARLLRDGSLELVGTMLRPHLDGVPPTWTMS